jgi:hypothetical protein
MVLYTLNAAWSDLHDNQFAVTMNQMLFRYLLLVSVLVAALPASAATYYSRTTGSFNTAGTWSVNPSGTPTNTTAITNADIFIIQDNHTVTVTANRTIAQLTVNSGGTLAFQTATLIISGDCLNNGTMSGSSGQVTINTGTFTNNGTFTYTTGRINRTTGDMVNNGSISGTSGRIIQTTGELVNSATGTIHYTATAVITFGTGNFTNLNSSDNVDFGTGNVTISGTAATQSIGGFTTAGRVSCTKTSGTVTFTGNVTSTGLTMNGSGATLDLGTGLFHTTNGTVILSAGTLFGNTSTLNVNVVSTSAWGGSSAAVFDPGTGTVNLGAAGAQRLSASGTKTFYNLTFSNSGLKTVVAPTIVNNLLSMEGDATASAAPTYGTAAGLRYNTSNPRTAGAEWLTPFAATGGVTIAGTGAISANNDKTFNETVTFNIQNGATFNAGTNDMTFNGDFVNAGTWTTSAGNVNIAGSVNQDIGSFETTGSLNMTKTGGVAIMQGDFSTGDLTMIGPGGIFRLGGGNTHTVSGTWTNTAGTLRCNTSTLNIDGPIAGSAISFNSNNGTVHFRGAGTQLVPGFAYHDLQFSGAGIKTLSANTTVDGVLAINTGAELRAGSVTLTLAGAGIPLVAGGTFTAESSTVLYSAVGAAEIAALDYYNLDCGAGDRTLSAVDTIGIAGSFSTGAGAYTVTGSIVNFNGDDVQTIPAFTYHMLLISNAGIKHIYANTTVTCRSIDIIDDASLEINADGGGKLDIID